MAPLNEFSKKNDAMFGPQEKFPGQVASLKNYSFICSINQ